MFNKYFFRNDWSMCYFPHTVTKLFILFFRLDEALSNYLGQAREYTEQEQQELEMPLPVRKCPQCSRDMVLKKKKDSTA